MQVILWGTLDLFHATVHSFSVKKALTFSVVYLPMLQGSAPMSTPSRSLCWPSQSELYRCTPLEHVTHCSVYIPVNVLSCWSLLVEVCIPIPRTVVPKVWFEHPWGSHFKTFPEGSQGQNYFHNDTKLFFFFFLTFLFSWIYSTHVSSRGYMICDLATDWMQKQIWDPRCLLVSQIGKTLGKKCRTMPLFSLDIFSKKIFFSYLFNM